MKRCPSAFKFSTTAYPTFQDLHTQILLAGIFLEVSPSFKWCVTTLRINCKKSIFDSGLAILYILNAALLRTLIALIKCGQYHFFSTDANTEITDKIIQRVYTDHKFIVKQNAILTLDFSVHSYFRRLTLDCGQREGSMDIQNNQNWTVIVP